jgi:hypothetical protein
MRNFNQEEKEILELIVYDSEKKYPTAKDRKRISVFELLEKMANDLKVQIDIDRKEKNLVLRSDKFGYRLVDGKKLPIIHSNWGEHLHNTFYLIEEKVALLLSVLDYLENNRFIYILPLNENKEDTVKLNKEYVSDIPDYIPSSGNFFTTKSSKFDYIFERLFDSIISTPELKEFVDKAFKDKEQIRHEENLALQNHSINTANWLGNVSIFIAVFSTVISSIFSILPEEPKKRFYNSLVGTTKNNTVEQLENSNNTGTVTGRKIQHINKTSLGSSKTSPKLNIPDTLKKVDFFLTPVSSNTSIIEFN